MDTIATQDRARLYEPTRFMEGLNMSFWFALFSPLIGLMVGLMLAWFFSSPAW